jgi:Dyp-type peroxidase family
MPHAFVTVVIPFNDRNAEAVDAHLDTLGNLAQKPLVDALDETAFVHFMSLTVVRGSSGGVAHLVLEANADGHPAGVLRRLSDVIGSPLCAILETAGIPVSPSQLGEFLVRHDRQVGQGWFSVTGVAFDGTVGMTVPRIRREEQLASAIQGILDHLPAQGSALATLARVRERLFGKGDFKWALVAEPAPLLAPAPKMMRSLPPLAWSAFGTFFWPLFVLPALALGFRGLWAAILTLGVELVLGSVAAGIAYLTFLRQEKADVPDEGVPSAQAVREIMARENQCVQNHLAAVSSMKPGWLRRLALRVVFWLIAMSAAYYRAGTLCGISTIHFARWILIPGTDKLLFFSNYTGSWESYLEDFILRAHEGLTSVWSNTRGFPKTQNLIQGGAEVGDPFKAWARRQQQPTRFWYSAYPGLTTERVRINAAIRDGFATASTKEEAERWLGSFWFVPPPDPTLDPTLDFEQIPVLVFSGLGGLQCALTLVLQLPGSSADARRWLQEIEPAIGYGERVPEESTVALGLSASGLKKLGLDPSALSTFPTAFQHGMAAPWRARALGDVGTNAPEGWWWGGTEKNEADAILNMYARSEEILEQDRLRWMQQFGPLGIKVIHQILLRNVPPRGTPLREPFGFVDGISQPIMRGAQKWIVARNRIHVVAPGEMILGYKDNFDHFPSAPSAAGCSALGHNGTYLVVRQLEQDTEAFQAFLRTTAAKLAGDFRVPALTQGQLEDWIAAKMVGRWRDGTSLVRHPDQPGSTRRAGTLPDNDFLFGAEDPHGLRCPFGAHIRRANPRETFEAGSEKQLAIANRHRIFRVGRTYVPQNGSSNPGLLFMCVNANIERQFEFVQQTYMLGSNFHGLENEVDPFARRNGSSDVLTILTERGPVRLKGLSNFVTVRGGGYFFMPGRSTVSFLARGR